MSRFSPGPGWTTEGVGLESLSAPGERSICDYCEAHVTVEFRRIYGMKSGRAMLRVRFVAENRKGVCPRGRRQLFDPQSCAECCGGQNLRGVSFIDSGQS